MTIKCTDIFQQLYTLLYAGYAQKFCFYRKNKRYSIAKQDNKFIGQNTWGYFDWNDNNAINGKNSICNQKLTNKWQMNI